MVCWRFTSNFCFWDHGTYSPAIVTINLHELTLDQAANSTHIHTLHPLKLTASLPLKMGAPWKRRFLLETTIFRGELLVSGRVKLAAKNAEHQWLEISFLGPGLFSEAFAVRFRDGNQCFLLWKKSIIQSVTKSALQNFAGIIIPISAVSSMAPYTLKEPCLYKSLQLYSVSWRFASTYPLPQKAPLLLAIGKFIRFHNLELRQITHLG